MSKKIIVSVGNTDLIFNMGHDDYNRFINETMPTDKINPAFNLLSRTIDEKSSNDFKKIALEDGKPKGMVIMQIAGAASEEFTGGVTIELKKPKESQTE